MNMISVVICTYNRCDVLDGSLRSVMQQDMSPEQYEIIVVDNNSTDGTKVTVEKLTALSRVKISYAFEKRQGLSHARNCGIACATGDIVVFADDDIEAEPQWLRELSAAFNSPNVACAGGPIRPLWPMERPQWLTQEWEGFLTVSEFQEARENGFFSYPNYPWGANMAFRKSVFDAVGVFQTDLGRTGTSLLSNEELNICKRIESAGFAIKFAPEAVIHHKIAPERMRKLWMMHRSYWQGRSDAILDSGNQTFHYSRLGELGRKLFWHHSKKGGADFSTICIDRNVTGYLHQLIIAHHEPQLTEFRKLRALKKFLSGFTKLASASVAEKKIAVLEKEIAQYKQWLADREEEIRDRDHWLAGRDNQMRQYQQWLADRENDLRDRDQWLADRDRQIAQYQQWLSDRERDILERDQWLADRDGQISQYKQWLIDREQDVNDRNQWLSDRNRDLRDREQWLADRDNQISQYKQWLSDRERDLLDRDQWLVDRDNQISQYKQWLSDRERDVHDRDQRLAESKQQNGVFLNQIQELKQSVAERDTLLAAKRQSLTESQQAIAAQVREIAQLRAKVEEGDRVIREFRDSLSWKITAPLRWLGGITAVIGSKN